MPSCLIKDLARALDALEVPLDQDTLAGSAEVTTLLDALTLVPDPRRRQGCRYSFTGLLSVTATAVICGAGSLAGHKNIAAANDYYRDHSADVLHLFGLTT